MTFDDILSQVLTLLTRQGRVSYRALKRRFDLDDDYIEDLKDELLFAHPVVDEDNRGLVWTGDTASGQEATSHRAQTTPQPAVQEQPSPEVTPRSTAPPDAERRQLTVMFIDIVESTSLSSQLDPEDYREVVRAYQSACTEVIQRFDGHIAQLLGDGLLVYFGYPHAHEDDAQRAVRTGLGLLDEMEDLQTSLHQDKGIQLALRVGIHTGLVVVGAMGSGDRQEQLALGETPNIAARIQGLAAPNTIAISEGSYRLVQGYFTCEALGGQTLRGVAEPLHVYRVLQESGATSRLDGAQPRGLTPLVGRESEVTLLLERWEQVKAGHGHVVLLTGDAGIGKSRLVQMLKDHVANEPHVRWECRSAEYAQNTALYPLTDFFQWVLHWQQSDAAEARLEKLEQELRRYRLPLAETIPMFASLLSLPIPDDRYPPLNLSPQRQRQKTLESIGAILLELAEQQPVLFILEDLHWTDPTTLEFLGLLVEQVPTAAIAILLSCRPHFQPSWHHRSYLTEITVHRLSRHQGEQIAAQVAGGKKLPAQVLDQIVEKTDGVPLFVEEMTKAVLESGHLKEIEGHYELIDSLTTFAIPATLQDSLMARLDRLVTAKAITQYAAVIGRQFAYDVLSTVSQLDDVTLQRELGRLVEAEIVYQRGVPPQATYIFKHALIQDAAYQSLLKRTRQQYHQRIAQVLAQQFPETVETQPELLAQHYTEAGLIAQAIPCWQRAGQRAIERSAHLEALSHLTKGLELLTTVPETPERLQHELDLQVPLGGAWAQTRGWSAPEVGQAYARARELCQRLGAPPQLPAVLLGQYIWYAQRAELQMAHELAEHLLTLAQRQADPVLLLSAHTMLGTTLFFRGEVVAAHTHVAQGSALYVPAYHRALVAHHGYDLGVFARCFGALSLWLLGAPEQALVQMHEARTLAQELSYPYSLAHALTHMTRLHQWQRDVPGTLTWSEPLIALSTEHGFGQYVSQGRLLHGWALVAQGQGGAGLDQMCQSLTAYEAKEAAIWRPYYLAILAEGYGQVGATDEGLRVLTKALAAVQHTGERVWEAELHRLKGVLVLQAQHQPPAPAGSMLHATGRTPQTAEAEAYFHQALAVARRQQAKSLELRAATSLARLWQQQGKRQEACDLLAPIYHWFTEGFDTADLQDAKALLDVLEEGR